MCHSLFSQANLNTHTNTHIVYYNHAWYSDECFTILHLKKSTAERYEIKTRIEMNNTGTEDEIQLARYIPRNVKHYMNNMAYSSL